jgi:putative transcriptional regulator
MRKHNTSSDDPIHNRIAVLRAERGLSRRDLAEAVGVHYQTVGYLERGEYAPSLSLAFKIARFFDLPFEAVFSDQPFGPMSQELYAARRTASPTPTSPTSHPSSASPPSPHDAPTHPQEHP